MMELAENANFSDYYLLETGNELKEKNEMIICSFDD